jgi:biotin transport system substrate-specific component
MEVTKKIFFSDSASSSSSVLTQAGWITLFAVFTALGAQVQIPHQPIPFTLQTFFVLLSGAFLGARNGFIAQLFYIAAGAVGLPVFTGATFGLVKIFGLTGGYLMSFPIAAALIGYLVTVRKGYIWTIISMSLGLIVVFTFGSLYLNFVAVHNIQQSIISGFLIFSWWDILKLSAAAAMYNEFSKRYRKLPV